MPKEIHMKINEEEIHNALMEAIDKVLKQNKSRTLLNEMVFPRKTYKERVENLIPQILENWCLVHYCTIIKQEENKSHWMGELRSHLLTLSRFSISGNDSPDSRTKVFIEIWDENDFNNPEFLNLTIANKFTTENIETTSKEYGQMLADCIESTSNIYNAILSRSINVISEYVSSI